MKKSKNLKGLIPLAASLLLLGSCSVATATSSSSAGTSNSSTASGSSTAVSAPTSTSSTTPTSYTAASSSATPTSYTSEEGEMAIVLADGASSSTSSNVAIDNAKNQIVISALGTYVLSGSLSDGSVIINAEKIDDDHDTVELILNGVSLTSKGTNTYDVVGDSATTTIYPGPIYSVASSKLDVKALSGSSSVITDARASGVEVGDDNAAIFSNKKLQIKGAGSLKVTSAHYSGLASDSKVEAAKTTLAVTAYSHAIKAHDWVILGGKDDLGSFTLTTTGSDETCVRVDEDNEVTTPVYGNAEEDDEIAGIELKDAAYLITSTGNALSSEAHLYLEGGNGSITSSAGKAVKAEFNIFIDGGDFTCKSPTDDVIHASEGSISITGGSYTLSTGTSDGLQAINATKDLNISGGLITVTSCYEGFQALTINATGGTTYVTASDDGWNATTGGETTSTVPLINISGGYHYLAAAGDGLDSNGNIVISGGFTVVSQTGGGNGPLDYGDGGSYYFKQSGGFLAAYGGNDMLVTSTGTQYSLLTSWSSAVTTSNYIIVTNSGISYAIKPQYQSAYSLYISSSDFVAGSVTVQQASSISGGSELFKGIYTGFTASGSSLATGGTWSTSSVNINAASGSSGGRTGPGGGQTGPGGR